MVFRFFLRIINAFKNQYNQSIEKFKTALVREQNLRIIAKYKSPPIINSSKVKLSKYTYLGDNCNFNGLEIRGGGKVTIGNNFHSGRDIIILTQFHNYDKGNCIPYDKIRNKKDIIIEDNVWIGSRVTILGGVTIGEGAVIQTGSVVAIDVPKYAVAGGHPAKPFKYRNIEHYEKLKKEGKFL